MQAEEQTLVPAKSPLSFLGATGRFLIPFLLATGATGGGLYLLGALGRNLAGELGVKSYANLENAQAHIGTRALLPAYFPESLKWPAQRVLAQKNPMPAVILLFSSRDVRRTELVLAEGFGISLSDLTQLEGIPRIRQVVSDSAVVVSGRPGRLVTGWEKEGGKWAQLTWRRERMVMLIATRLPLYELLRIAESMEP
jgi:hypothetical protein